MHLSSYQITRFHHAGLAPTELLAIDDHLLECEFCRQQLRSNLNLPVALCQLQKGLQKEFQEFSEERHLSPEDRTAYVQNRLSRVERELATSHLQSCAQCKTQIEFLQNDRAELPPTIGNVVANTLAFFGGRAALIWPIPITAIFVIVLIAFVDYWFFRQPEITVAPPPIQRTIQRNEPASGAAPDGRAEFANSNANSQPKQKKESRKSSKH